MNEQRQELYKQLVNQLLNCLPGEEINLLQANRDLVDLGLFYTIAQAANYFTTQNDYDTAAWLDDLNRELIAANGFNSLDEMYGEYFNCLVSILEVVDQNPDPEAVYPLLHSHLDKLDLNLAWVLQVWWLGTLGNAEPQSALAIARIISNLAWIIQEFPQGNIANHLEIAIIAYGLVLTIYTESDFPQKWATIQYNLGNAYLSRIRGDKAENLELAIECYKLALQVYTKQDFPEEWATIQYNLRAAYSIQIRGGKAENLELAIDSYKQALRVFTEQDSPLDWAITQNNLGLFYSNRIRGDRAENLELEIECYQNAIRVYTEQDFPQDWVRIQYNLGIVYNNRVRGDRAENLELSIECSQSSLRVFTEQDFPQEWAITQNNLGLDYSERIRGDRAENLELAIDCYKKALRVYTEQGVSPDWARTQNNLGIVYNNRIRGNRAENLELAIECSQSSLRVYTEQDFPPDWARNRVALGMAYQNRIRGDKTNNLEKAIEFYQSSLRVFTEQNFPQNFGRTQLNLGTAYQYRIRGDKTENLEKAIEFYQSSLRVYTEQDFPQELAMTQHNLGAAYSIRIRGDRAENLERAIDCYHNALRLRPPESNPIDCLATARNLGNLALTNANWSLAINAYDKAITALELSRSWAMDDDRRQEIIAESIDVYMNMVQACINDGDVKKAIEYAERSRAKQLVDLMASNDLYQSGEIPEEVQNYLSQYEHLQERIYQLHSANERETNRALATAETRTITAETWQKNITEIQQLKAEKSALWQQIRRFDSIIAGQKQVDPLNFKQMQQLIDRNSTALLSFYTTDNDTYIFILYRDREPVIYTCTEEGIANLQDRFIRNNWLIPYLNSFGQWQQNITNVLQELAQRLKLDLLIEQSLTNIDELIIVPHLLLHQIPFAALPITLSNPNSDILDNIRSNFAQTSTTIETKNLRGLVIPQPNSPTPASTDYPSTQTPKPQYLSDRFRLRILPSCQILNYCHQRPPIAVIPQMGIVEDATADLPYTAYECETLATTYNIDSHRRLQRQQATVTAYRQLANNVQILHSSHHASANHDNPLESQLILSDRSLTLGELLNWRIPHLTDVYLNNCETNFNINQITDDLLTISTGFLCAGARNVVSTLWSVEDCASALLAIFYYEFRQVSSSRSLALQQAQQKLRTLTGEELKDDYYQQLIDRLQQQLEQIEHSIITQIEIKPEEKKKATKMVGTLNYQINKGLLDRCQEAYPFANPYYWAGFISQGIA